MRLNDLGQGKLEGPKIDPRVVIIRPGFNYRNAANFPKPDPRRGKVTEIMRPYFYGTPIQLYDAVSEFLAALDEVKP